MDDSFLDWETRDEKFPFYKHVIAGTNISVPLSLVLGSCAGIVEHVGMFPLDTIKVSISRHLIDRLSSFHSSSYLNNSLTSLIDTLTSQW